MNPFIYWTGGSFLLWLIVYLFFFVRYLKIGWVVSVIILYVGVAVLNFLYNPYGGPDGILAGIEYAGPVLPLLTLAIGADNKNTIGKS